MEKLETNKLVTDYKMTIGCKTYSTDWLFVAKDYEFKFLFFDINIDPQFDISRNTMMKGTHSSIIIFDFSQPEILSFLEKWILEIIITCGNVPILLLGIYNQEDQQKPISDIVNLLVSDRRNDWNISIDYILTNKEDFEFNQVIEYLSNKMLDRINNPELVKLPTSSIKKIEDTLKEINDINYINHIFKQLNNRNKFESKKILEILTNDFFVNLVHQQNNLAGLSRLLDTLNLLDDTIVNEILSKISIEKMINIIEQEKELYEIILLFNKYLETNNTLWEKLLEEISSDFLVAKLSQSWIDVTIEAKWSHSTIMGFVKLVDNSKTQSSEIIRYVSLKEQKRKENETLNDICLILDLIFTTDATKAVKVFEDLPSKIKEIAKTILTKDKEVTFEEKESIKNSLEEAELVRKEAAKKEIEYGLNELILLITWFKQLPLESKKKLIEKITLEKINEFINEKISFLTFTQFLESLNVSSKDLCSKIFSKNFNFVIKKIINEPDINIIHRFLEIANKINPDELQDINNQLGIQFFVKRMLSHYYELELEKLDVPLLIGLVDNYKDQGKQMALEIFQYLFADVPYTKLTNLYILLSELRILVKEKQDIDDSSSTAKIMEIYDFFIEIKLEELNKLNQTIAKFFSKSRIREVFNSELLTEGNEHISYEKRKLLDFIKDII